MGANADQMNFPGTKSAAVTTSDTVAIATGVSRGLIVTTAGNYSLVLQGDTSAVPMFLAAGVVHPLRVKRVNTTSAASTSGIVAIY